MATCETTKLIPGPKGDAGSNGSNGSNGADAFTTLTANFTVPAVAGTSVATVGSTAWMVVGQPLFLQNGGVFYVTAIGGATSVTLQNPAAETGNVAPATVVAIGNRVAPSGFKGVAGTNGGAGTGVTVATKGDIQTYAGAPANLAVGTNGQLLRSLSAAGTGLDWEQIIPNATAATDDNKIAIANCPLGTETPANLQFTLAKVTDTGAYQTVGGNARGVDAVDQQPARAAATQVASGNNSGILSGRNNTASGQGSVVAGGEGNLASGADSVVGGGANNSSSAQNAAIVGGNANVASGVNSFVAAGNTNTASGVASAVLSGDLNTASGQGAVVMGESNAATGTDSSALGGALSTASADVSATVGGLSGKAYLFGQIAHASGAFAAQGDAQTSELVWKVATTDATVTEMNIGPAGQLAVVPNNTTWAFNIIGVARRDNGTSISFEVKGAIKNTGGVTVLVAAVTASVIADGTGAAMTIANFTVDADDPNNSLRIRVTGIVGQAWRWMARARLVEVSY